MREMFLGNYCDRSNKGSGTLASSGCLEQEGPKQTEAALLWLTHCVPLPLTRGVGTSTPSILGTQGDRLGLPHATPLLTSPSRLNHIFKNAIVVHPGLSQEVHHGLGTGRREGL